MGAQGAAGHTHGLPEQETRPCLQVKKGRPEAALQTSRGHWTCTEVVFCFFSYIRTRVIPHLNILTEVDLSLLEFCREGVLGAKQADF